MEDQTNTIEENISDQFVSKFSLIMSTYLTSEETAVLTNRLSEFCTDYTITKRCTDIVTYEAIIPQWIEEYAVAKITAGCKENSVKDYLLHLKMFFEFVSLPISEITEGDINKYISNCLRIKENSKGYVDHKRTVLSDFFSWSFNKGYIQKNPMLNIPSIKANPTKRIPYTSDELTTIRNEVDNIHDKAIIETLYSTACRIEELCRLNIDDVDFYENTVKLFGKGDKHRVSFMNSEMKHALQKYLDSRKDNNPALFVGRRRSRTTKKYERITIEGTQFMLRELGRNLDIENVQAHRFRKTRATNLYKSGMKLANIQKMLGHESIETTMRYVYTDTSEIAMEFKKYGY